MGTVLSVVGGLVIMALTNAAQPIVQAKFVLPIKQRQARKRFAAEPLVSEGVVLSEIRRPGSDRALCGRCEIVSLRVGRIEVRPISGKRGDRTYSQIGEALSWTLAEFEGFDPVTELWSVPPRTL